jgi:hypothetical protein
VYRIDQVRVERRDLWLGLLRSRRNFSENHFAAAGDSFTRREILDSNDIVISRCFATSGSHRHAKTTARPSGGLGVMRVSCRQILDGNFVWK